MNELLLIAGLAIAAGMLPYAAYYLAVNQRSGSSMQKRLKRASGVRKLDAAEAVNRAYNLRRAAPQGSALTRHLPNIGMLQKRLERAGSSISAKKYLLYCLTLMLIVFLLFFGALAWKWPVAGFLALVIGLGLPHWLVGMQAKRRVTKFVGLFPEAIDLIVRGLRSGLPIQEGFKVVSEESADPVACEFAHIANMIKLGVPVEKALADTAAHLSITEFDFFVTSIALQRETGGNLAEILGNLSETIRHRHMMRLKIKALSSEAKASAIIVGCLPFGVMTAVAIISPGYLDPLFNDFRGNLAGLCALGSLSTGIWIMKKMASFEI